MTFEALRRGRRWRRALCIAGLAGALAMVLVVATGWVALVRLQAAQSVDLARPAGHSGAIYLLVGEDGGIARHAADSQADEMLGARADVLVLVRINQNSAASVISVPRDLLVDQGGFPSRAALTLQGGAQSLVDGLCGALGVAIDHYVSVDAAAFPEVIDSLGGLRIDLRFAIRDTHHGLDLAAGDQVLSGRDALLFARTRHAETFIDGAWQMEGEALGAQNRAARAGILLRALQEQISDADPFTLLRGAWQIPDRLKLNAGTGIAELQALVAARVSDIEVLATEPVAPEDPAVLLNDAGREQLRLAGFDTSCRVG